ncbi:MAG: polysaccharide deacetylase family protein [Candidatus Eisenbacteria bacterium]|nr:polysaccharide deacetylase family protein [Candidatus Eisenbacteria bacterium]
MKTHPGRLIRTLTICVLALALAVTAFCVFFDEAVFLRKGTVYRVPTLGKVVALTFDDGPSPVWTPRILDELKALNVKATFFVLGKHVREYPEIARRTASEGHEIENHSYDHHVIIYYRTNKLEKEIRDTESIVNTVTGRTTRYFRPPKAWLTNREKTKIEKMGYKVVLWSLNSKDWVTFDDKYVLKYLLSNVQPGDVILFHDSGGVLGTEGGNREETIKTIHRLVPKLRERGYRFVTVEELLGGTP